MADGIEWHRPLTPTEVFLYESNKEGFAFISYVLRVSTPRPLTEEDGQKVFRSLYRKVPNLRLCVEEKDGQPWLRKIKGEVVDFKVLKDADVFKTYHDIPEEMFAFKGALWRARLLPWSPNQSSFVEKTSFPGEKTKFPHVSHVVVYFSHTITDGYSCMRIMRTILSLFNDVVSGNPIDDSEQVGTLIDVGREERILREIRKSFEDNPAFLEERKESFCRFPMETIFEKAYPVPPSLKPQTFCLVHNVEAGLTEKFIKRCKKEGVTVHTGFCTLIEAAIIKLIQEANLGQDSFTLSSLHAADNRVYYDNCHNEFGVGIGVMDFTHEVKTYDLSDFWAQAQIYHKRFKKQHSYKPGLEHALIEELTGATIDPLPKEGQSSPSKKMSYYCTTNMRDITAIFSSCGDNIELEFLDRLTTMHQIPCIWMNTFNTYKGRFWHSLQYNAHVMSLEVAQKYSDTLFEMFAKVVDF